MTDYFVSRSEKFILPPLGAHDDHRAPANTDTVRMGRVTIDNDLCNGCKLCVMACPPKALVMTGKRSVAMKGDFAACIGCGDCVAICHPRAIDMVKFMEYDGLYKHIGRGEPSPPRRL